MRRFGPRDAALSLLLAVVVFFAFTAMRQTEQRDTPIYSQIRAYFVQEQVEYFTLEDNTLTLTLKSQGSGEPIRVTYHVANPMIFYEDMRDLINEQLDSGVLMGCDYPPGVESSWWYHLVPYLVAGAD